MKNKKKLLDVPNNLANTSQVAGIFENLDKHLKYLLKNDQLDQKPLLVCSGGTSSRCAANKHWSLDLRKNFDFINLNLNTLEADIGGGISMGRLVNELSLNNRSFPIGLSGKTGIGYILTGGISPLSRSEGLAIDQVVEIEGVWGNGSDFLFTKPNKLSSKEDELIWKGLCGAAPFLGIISKLKIQTKPIEPLIIWQSELTIEELSKIVISSEKWSNFSSLQWTWADKIKAYGVFKINKERSLNDLTDLKEILPYNFEKNIIKVNGIKDLPLFNASYKNKTKSNYNSEVIGLLSKNWASLTPKILSIIDDLIQNKPHSRCCIAAQQLGGETKANPYKTSFIHRKAIWKPWITATWPQDDLNCREESLYWLKGAWDKLEPYCIGIHLAQMHQHLNWNSRACSSAFGEWMPGLKKLKKNFDPNVLLPSFL